MPHRLPPLPQCTVDVEVVAAELRLSLEEGGPRAARAIIRNGPLRVTLIVLPPGGDLAEHSAPGPITVHLLRGDLIFTHQGVEETVPPGGLLTLDDGIPHTVRSVGGAEFLLTIVV